MESLFGQFPNCRPNPSTVVVSLLRILFTPPTPTQLNSTVESRRRRPCVLGLSDGEVMTNEVCYVVCISAESVNVEKCRYQDSYNISVSSIPASEGYISSQAFTDVPAACDRADRPWVIAAQHGQRINLTLFNFTPLRPNQLNRFPSPYDNVHHPDSHTQPGQF